MNELIKKLVSQCDIEIGSYEYGSRREFDYEKFAELLIKDVLSELERERGYYAEPSTYQDIEYYIRCAAKEEILAELIGTFKIQYGVE